MTTWHSSDGGVITACRAIALPILKQAVPSLVFSRVNPCWYVLWWMFMGYLVLGQISVWNTSDHFEYVFAASLLGMMLGWVCGMVHGLVVVLAWPDPPEPQPEESLTLTVRR